MRKGIIASACGLAAMGGVASYFVLHHDTLATKANQQNEQVASVPDSASHLHQRSAPVYANDASAITPTHNEVARQPKDHVSGAGMQARATHLPKSAVPAAENRGDGASVDVSAERRTTRVSATNRVADNLVARPVLTAKTPETVSAVNGVPQHRPESGGAEPHSSAPQAQRASVGDAASSRIAIIAIPSRPRT